jgi:hypothetical protein
MVKETQTIVPQNISLTPEELKVKFPKAYKAMVTQIKESNFYNPPNDQCSPIEACEFSLIFEENAFPKLKGYKNYTLISSDPQDRAPINTSLMWDGEEWC